jgi:hypothetical protein
MRNFGPLLYPEQEVSHGKETMWSRHPLNRTILFLQMAEQQIAVFITSGL